MITIRYHFFSGNIPHQMRYCNTSIGLNKFCLFTEEYFLSYLVEIGPVVMKEKTIRLESLIKSHYFTNSSRIDLE